MRSTHLEGKDQLTLGELIKKVKQAGVVDEDGEPKMVYFDFGYIIPSFLHSWRGNYNELAISYDKGSKTAGKLLEELEDCIGSVHTGWIGGDYTMTEDTPLWVANKGHSGGTVIIDVVNQGYQLIILTTYCDC